MIATGGEGEKVDLKICLAMELNRPQRNISLQIICSSIFSILSPVRPLAIRMGFLD